MGYLRSGETGERGDSREASGSEDSGGDPGENPSEESEDRSIDLLEPTDPT